MLNRKEKEYYNTFLAVSKSSRGKPFTLRSNFDGFENTKDYPYLKKISYFFSQFPQIKPNIFFKAPYELFKDEDWFDLKFFASQKAVKTYTIYFKKLQEESPDSESNIQFIKESLHFIGMFCIKNKLPLKEYLNYSIGCTKCWMKHVRQHNVSLYVMLSFPEVMEIISETAPDELDCFFGDDINYIHIYKQRLSTSKTAKPLIKEGVKRINSFIEKTLKEGDNYS